MKTVGTRKNEDENFFSTTSTFFRLAVNEKTEKEQTEKENK